MSYSHNDLRGICEELDFELVTESYVISSRYTSNKENEKWRKSSKFNFSVRRDSFAVLGIINDLKTIMGSLEVSLSTFHQLTLSCYNVYIFN